MKQVRTWLNEKEYEVLECYAKELNITIYATLKSLLYAFLYSRKPSVKKLAEISFKRQILSELNGQIKGVNSTCLFIPNNELGVVLLFGRYYGYLGFQVLDVHSEYPDCIAIKNGKRVKIEFEYKTSNFITHNHDLNEVDLVICWIKDVELPIQILELRSELAHFYPKRINTYLCLNEGETV